MKRLYSFFVFFMLVVCSIGFSFGQSNRCVIKMDGKYGYIDTLGNIVIKPQFDWAIQFTEGLAAVKLNGKNGYINTSGEWVIKAKFDGTDGFFEGFARIWVDDKDGMINKKGKLLIPPKYDYVSTANEGFCYVVKGEFAAFFDLKKRKFITQFVYEKDEVWDFNEGLAMVKIGKNYGFIDTDGNVALAPIYRQVGMMQFSCGLASVRSPENGLWGYVNKEGKQIVPYQYGEASSFSENMAFVQEGWNIAGYFIDTTGKRLFDKTFNDAWGFKAGLCGVEINKKYGIIDSIGNWLVEPKYDWIHVFFHDGWIAFYNRVDGNAKWGILNTRGEEVFSERFEIVIKNDGDCNLPEVYTGECSNSSDDCARGYVNLRGEMIWEPTK